MEYSSEDDYARSPIEEAIGQAWAISAMSKATDIGSCEMDAFVHADDPLSAFQNSKAFLGLHDGLNREMPRFDEDEYLAIHPLDHVSVI